MIYWASSAVWLQSFDVFWPRVLSLRSSYYEWTKVQEQISSTSYNRLHWPHISNKSYTFTYTGIIENKSIINQVSLNTYLFLLTGWHQVNKIDIFWLLLRANSSIQSFFVKDLLVEQRDASVNANCSCSLKTFSKNFYAVWRCAVYDSRKKGSYSVPKLIQAQWKAHMISAEISTAGTLNTDDEV